VCEFFKFGFLDGLLLRTQEKFFLTLLKVLAIAKHFSAVQKRSNFKRKKNVCVFFG